MNRKVLKSEIHFSLEYYNHLNDAIKRSVLEGPVYFKRGALWQLWGSR